MGFTESEDLNRGPGQAEEEVARRGGSSKPVLEPKSPRRGGAQREPIWCFAAGAGGSNEKLDGNPEGEGLPRGRAKSGDRYAPRGGEPGTGVRSSGVK